MAGLLDLFNNPEMQLGMGLLAAAGPTTDPNKTGFGARMQDAMGYAQAQQDAEQKRKFMKSQMDNYASEIEARKLATAKDARQQKLIESLFGTGGAGGGISPVASAPSIDGSGPTMQPQMIPQAGGLAGMTPDMVARLKLAGLDIADIYKFSQEPQKYEPGSIYRDRNTGQERFIPKVGEGIAPGADGVYKPLPGYSSANAGIKGAETFAIEGARAGLDLVDVPDGNGGTQKMPRAQAVKLLGGNQAQQPIQNMGNARMSPDLAEFIRRDAEANGITNPIADFYGSRPGGIAQLNGQSSQIAPAGRFGTTPSPAEQARAVKTAEADVVRDTTNKADSKRYGQFSAGIDRAIELLGQGPTASGIGSVVDTALGAFGTSTKGGDVASQLKTLSGWLTSNVPRMEGPQSDKDVINYQVQSGMVGDQTKPISQRLTAAKEVKRLQDKYASLNGYSGGAEGDFGDAKPAAPKSAPIPMKGMIRNGYKFKGGDPSNQANWEKQ